VKKDIFAQTYEMPKWLYKKWLIGLPVVFYLH
jgi:hypothetical protein